MKKLLFNLAKIAISVALLGLLGYQGWRIYQQEPDAFNQLVHGPKDWGLLAAALAVAMTAVLLTFLRWRLLVQGLGLSFPVGDALRLGFVGYLFNFTLGVVGGDVIKAVAIARRQPGHQAAAAATVVVDRLFGLYALFVVGAAASLTIDFAALRVEDSTQLAIAQSICRTTQVLTVVGAIGFALLLLPGLATSPLWEMLIHIPKAGPTLIRILEAVRMYRRQPALLLTAFLMSLGVHCLYSLAIYLIARGLPGDDPSLAANFVVAPIAMVAGAVPGVPGGLGAFEGGLAFMYQALSPAEVSRLQGLVIAVAFRVITLVVALIGAIYYAISRREVNALMEVAEGEKT